MFNNNGLGSTDYMGDIAGVDTAYGTPSPLSPAAAACPPDATEQRPAYMRIVPNAEDVAQERAALCPTAPVYGSLPMGELGQVQRGTDLFVRWARFGLIDNGALLLSTIAGFSLDDIIAKKVGVKGYGVIVGALIGNALSDGLAALPEGKSAAAGVTTGALIPIAPVAVAMALKRPMTGKTAWAVGLSSALLLVMAFRTGRNSTGG